MKKYRVRLTVVVTTFADSPEDAILRASSDLGARLVDVDRTAPTIAAEVPLEPWEVEP